MCESGLIDHEAAFLFHLISGFSIGCNRQISLVFIWIATLVSLVEMTMLYMLRWHWDLLPEVATPDRFLLRRYSLNPVCSRKLITPDSWTGGSRLLFVYLTETHISYMNFCCDVMTITAHLDGNSGSLCYYIFRGKKIFSCGQRRFIGRHIGGVRWRRSAASAPRRVIKIPPTVMSDLHCRSLFLYSRLLHIRKSVTFRLYLFPVHFLWKEKPVGKYLGSKMQHSSYFERRRVVFLKKWLVYVISLYQSFCLWYINWLLCLIDMIKYGWWRCSANSDAPVFRLY